MRQTPRAPRGARRNLQSPKSRRGAIAVAFAVGASAVLGAAALATEAGLWYAARRNAQTAADLAAYAAVAQIAWRGSNNAAGAVTVGRSVAAANGFATDTQPTTVTVTPCIWTAPTCVANNAAPNAVQVDIEQTQRLGLAALISDTPPIVRVRGVATIRNVSRACLLSLTGETSMTGSSTVNADECAVASNRQGESIDCGNAATINVGSFVAVGTAASECSNRGAPVLENQLPITDPYAHLQNVTLPSFQQNDCQKTNGNGSIVTTLPNGGRRYEPLPYNMNSTGPYTAETAICDDIRLNNANDELILVPGTYFFADADLRVTGGYVRCPTCTGGQGVTLVFTQLTQGSGNNSNNRFGNIHITGGDVQLSAPSSGPWYNETFVRPNPSSPGTNETTSIFDGILVYRDVRATPNNEKNVDNLSNTHTARITGNADAIRLDGAMYLPSSQVFVAGTAAVANDAQDCQSIVAATVQVTGNSGLSVSGCRARGTAVAESRVIRLVQ